MQQTTSTRTKELTEQHRTYLAWLNDAHAMERALITVLEKQEKETTGTDLQPKISKHLEETRRHADLVKACIVRNGGDPSAFKDMSAQMGAAISGFTMSMMEDAMVKNMLKSYSSEHFEIASYLAIQAAAEELGDTETVTVCETILKDELRMAEWVRGELPRVVARHMAEL